MTLRAHGIGTTKFRKAKLTPLVATLALAGCDHDFVKTWEGGGRIEAKLTAEKCPDAGTAVPKPPRSRGIEGECKEYPEGEFSAFTRLHIVETLEDGTHPPFDRDEVWRIACFRGLCEAATFDGSALEADEPLRAFQLKAWRGVVVSRRDRVVTAKFTGLADQLVTVDLAARTIHYKQTFKSGLVAVGDGSCARTGKDTP